MNEILDKEANEFLDKISKNVIKARLENEYSQLKLATEMGYTSASYLGRQELRIDNQHFNIVQLYKISKILGIEISTLLK